MSDDTTAEPTTEPAAEDPQVERERQYRQYCDERDERYEARSQASARIQHAELLMRDALYLQRATWHEHYSRVLSGLLAGYQYMPCDVENALPLVMAFETIAFQSTIRMHGEKP